MDKEVLVKAEGVSKKFCKDFATSLRYGMADVLRRTAGRSLGTELRPGEFWALDDISFELRRGQCIGLIGHNGAGKSTLLKVLNGILSPDRGQVTMRGKVGALIELGAGFNPILTGRENIYNNGAVLGFSRQQMDERIEDIIDFSEIREFIDSPVRNYSSGMKVRLGFAVASHMEPDILIIDEVLAVGDTGFRLKCFAKLDELLRTSAAIFVTHNMPQIIRTASDILLLDHGKVDYSGSNVGMGVEKYYEKFKFDGATLVYDSGEARIDRFDIVVGEDRNPETIDYLSDIILDVKCYVDPQYVEPVFGIIFFDKELKPAATTVTPVRNSPDGNMEFKIIIPRLTLSTGQFNLTLSLQGKPGLSLILRQDSIATIKMAGDEIIWSPVRYEWELDIAHEVPTA